jgi:hypothetical protein
MATPHFLTGGTTGTADRPTLRAILADLGIAVPINTTDVEDAAPALSKQVEAILARLQEAAPLPKDPAQPAGTTPLGRARQILSGGV